MKKNSIAEFLKGVFFEQPDQPVVSKGSPVIISDHAGESLPVRSPNESAIPRVISSNERLIEVASKIGKEFALVTRAQKVDNVALKSFEEHAEALALGSTPPLFDPNAYLIDRRTESRISRLDHEELERDEAVQISASALRQRDEELAGLGPHEPCAKPSPALKWTAAICISFSIAPLIHDQLTSLFPLLKWIIAIGFALGYGIF